MTTSDMQAITLYYAPDNASLIVRMLLEELELVYKTELVDRSAKEQQSERYLHLNPEGLIPVCIINGDPVFETAAILLSLADSSQAFTVSLKHRKRPQFLKWLFYLSNSLHADLRQRFYPQKYAGQNRQSLQDFALLTLDRMNRRFAIFDNAYANSAADYLFGDEPTIVDLYLAVCFRWAQLYPIECNSDFETSGLTAIRQMAERLERRPFIQKACALEGITGMFFSQPEYADPPEGVAL